MDDTVRPTDTSRSLPAARRWGEPFLSRKGLEVRGHRGRGRHHRFVVPGTQGTPVLSFDHRDADGIQAVVLSENSLGVRGGLSDWTTSSRVKKVMDGRGSPCGGMPMAPRCMRGWAYASGARPKGGIVIGGDNEVPFGGLIDEVRVWNRRLSDEELDMILATLLLSADPFLIERIDTPERVVAEWVVLTSTTKEGCGPASTMVKCVFSKTTHGTLPRDCMILGHVGA